MDYIILINDILSICVSVIYITEKLVQLWDS